MLHELKTFIIHPYTYFTQKKEQDHLYNVLTLFFAILLAKGMLDHNDLIANNGVPAFFVLLLGTGIGLFSFFIFPYWLEHNVAKFLNGKGTYQTLLTCNLLIPINLTIIMFPLYSWSRLINSQTMESFFRVANNLWVLILLFISLQVCHELPMRKNIIAYVISLLLTALIYGAYLIARGILLFIAP